MRKWILGVSAVLMLCLVGSAWVRAEEEGGAGRKPRGDRKKREVPKDTLKEKQKAGPQAMGRVKSVDVEGGKIVVLAFKRGEKQPEERTFLINAETKVTMGGEEVTLRDVGEGKSVTVQYKDGADGATATLIVVRLPMAMGKVKSVDVDAKKVVVTTARGKETKEMTFATDDATKVYAGRDQKTLADVAAGSNVTVEYKEGKDGGEATAVTIRIRVVQPRQPRVEKKKEVEADEE